jgi:hypothetical protein
MSDDLVQWLRNKSSEHNMYRCDEAADRIEQLEAAHERTAHSLHNYINLCSDLMDREKRLEAALREIYEVYAGSEGIPQPISASEGYLLQLIKDMVAISRAALAGRKKDD